MSPRGRLRFSFTGVLLAAVLFAALWAWRAWNSGEPEAPPPPSIALPADFGAVTGAVFREPGDSIVVVVKDGFPELIHPWRERADERFFAELERQARSLAPRRHFPEGDLEEYGLGEGARTLRLRNARGDRWGIALGDTAPGDAGVYARSLAGGGPIALLDLFAVRNYLMPGLERLRDHAVVRLASGPLDSIEIHAAGQVVRAGRNGQGRWRARVEPGGRFAELDPERIEQVVQVWRASGIRRFLPAEAQLGAMGLDPPRATWILRQGARSETLRVGHPTADGAEVHLLPPGRHSPALVEGSRFRNMVGGLSAVIDLRLVGIPFDSLRSVDFSGIGEGSYERTVGGWRRLPPGTILDASNPVARDLRNLTLLQGVRDAPGPTATPRGDLILTLRSTARAETLFLAAPSDGPPWARSTRHPRWIALEPTVWGIWEHRGTNPE